MNRDPWGNSIDEQGAADPNPGSESLSSQESKEASKEASKEKSRPRTSRSSAQDADEMKILQKWAGSVMKEQRATRRWGIFFKSLTFLYLFALLGIYFSSQSFVDEGIAVDPHVAVVELKGTIADDQEASADSIIGALRRAFKAEQSRAVIVRINSPGGSPVQSGYIYDEMQRLRALNPDKPLYAVITDIGASGGYYVAAAADEIYADKASLVGSIGVISSGFGFVDLMDKLGIERRALTAGESKALLDPFQPLGDEQKAFWQQVLNTTHAQFIDQVKQGRGERLSDDPALFTGLIWTGEQALELGLIDGLASSSQVARDKHGVEKLVDYSSRPNAIERITERLGVAVGSAIANQLEVNSLLKLH